MKNASTLAITLAITAASLTSLTACATSSQSGIYTGTAVSGQVSQDGTFTIRGNGAYARPAQAAGGFPAHLVEASRRNNANIVEQHGTNADIERFNERELKQR